MEIVMKKRKTYTDNFKRKVLAEIDAGATQAEVVRNHKLTSGMVSNWSKNMANRPTRTKPKPAKVNGTRNDILLLRQYMDDVKADMRAGKLKDFTPRDAKIRLALAELEGQT
jgi:transposase-like protein